MVELCSRFQFGVDTLRPLVEKVDSLDEQSLEYVLWVLASTHDPSVRHVIERFVDHDSAVVREGVADALSELGDPA
jgi:hypothetical protein